MANKNIPVNFDKIHDETIRINSDEFSLEVDMGHDSDVWVFPANEAEYGYVMYFKIDWTTKTFQMLKARLGDGRNFIDVAGKGVRLNLHRHYYQTKKDFLNFLTQYTELNISELKR